MFPDIYPALTLPDLMPTAPAADVIVAGLAAGTLILTLSGECPVQDLCPGDRIITRGTGIARVTGLRIVDTTVALVRVGAGTIGHTRPERDARLGPGTPVLIRDWRAAVLYGQPSAMVHAGRLVDGEFIAREAAVPVRLYVPTFERRHVIYADGLEIGTDY